MTVTRQTRRTAGSPVIAVLLLLLAVWLFGGAWILGYGVNEPANDAHLNEIGVSAGLIIAMLLRLKRPSRGHEPVADVVAIALGGWLVAAPFVIGYGDTDLADVARWNDVIVGILIVVLAGVNLAFALRDRRTPPRSG